jgi:hypothetical protein
MAEDTSNAAAEGSQPVPPPQGIDRRRHGGYRGRQGRGGAAPVTQRLAAIAAHVRRCGAPPRVDARGA